MPPDSPGQTYQDQAATKEKRLGRTAMSGLVDHDQSKCRIQGHGLPGLRLKVWPVGNGPQAYMDVLAAAFRRSPGDPWPLHNTLMGPLESTMEQSMPKEFGTSLIVSIEKTSFAPTDSLIGNRRLRPRHRRSV